MTPRPHLRLPRDPLTLRRTWSARFWILGALGLVFYNGLIAFQAWRDREASLDAARLEATRTARLLGEQIAGNMAFIAASLETLELLVRKLPPMAEDSAADLVRAMMDAKVKRLDLVRGFIVTDADGGMVIDETGRPTRPLDLSDRDYFRAHLEPDPPQFYVGEPVLGRTSGQWFLGVSKRRTGPAGRFDGVLAAVVEPAHLSKLLGDAGLDDGGVAALLSPAGTILARSTEHGARLGGRAAEDAALGIAAPHDPGRIVGTFAVPDFAMTVLVSLDVASVLRPWHGKLPWFLVVMLLPSAAVLAALAAVVRKQRALAGSEGALRAHVTELQETRERLEEQAATMRALAEQNAVARSRAEAANMAKSLFLANMSHELRTPLNVIIGFGEMIERQELGPVGNPEYVAFGADIQTAGRHLLEMINDILDLSKIEASKYVLNIEPVSLPALAGACLRLVRGRAREAGIALNDQVPQLPAIQADERAVRQVLINLLANAIKFTNKGGSITLDAVAEDGFVRVSVTDTGVGIKAEDIPRLGRPFEQAANQPSGGPSGTGLGLALSRRLVELHGGRLEIRSELGVGTTVSFTLPLGGPPQPVHAAPAEAEVGAGI